MTQSSIRVPSEEGSINNGVFAPTGMPRPIIKTVHATIQKALAHPDVKKLYAAQGLVPLGRASSGAFGRLFRADFDRIAKLAKVAGIKPDSFEEV